MKKHMKKLVFPLFLITLCFMTAKMPVVSPTMLEDASEQIMPLSNMENPEQTQED